MKPTKLVQVNLEGGFVGFVAPVLAPTGKESVPSASSTYTSATLSNI
jgi:hypothetical protein